MATLEREIAGQPTQILFQPFTDRILLVVTQVGKVGNLVSHLFMLQECANVPKIQVTLPTTNTFSPDPPETTDNKNTLPVPSPTIQLTPLLGGSASDHHQTLQSLYASQIATIIWESPSQSALDGNRRSVVVGLALKRVGNAGSGCELSEEERATFQGVMRMLQDMLKGTPP